MKQFILFVFVFLAVGVEAQTLEKHTLEQYARNALVEGIEELGDNVNQADVIIMEVNSSNVIVNVSIGQCHSKVEDFVTIFYPENSPKWTVGVYVNKHDKPVSRAIAAQIAGRIIEHMANYMLVTESKPYKYHPAEKGR